MDQSTNTDYNFKLHYVLFLYTLNSILGLKYPRKLLSVKDVLVTVRLLIILLIFRIDCTSMHEI